jgi:hypothetical protein
MLYYRELNVVINMKTKIFDQDRAIANVLDNWQSQSVDCDHDQIIIVGRPDTKFDGTSEQMKLVLRIERVEIIRVIYPEAPVDERPYSGACTLNECEFRRMDGKCTFDPFEEKCQYKIDGCDDQSPDENGRYHV